MASTNSDAKIANQVVLNEELETLPNDLTRMLYLASLRDCNTGVYLHPRLSEKMGMQEANHAILALHDEVFRRLLMIPVSDYVIQLDQYIQYAKAEPATALNTWESLQAYRATVPVNTLQIYCDLFFLNIESAIKILQTSRSV